MPAIPLITLAVTAYAAVTQIQQGKEQASIARKQGEEAKASAERANAIQQEQAVLAQRQADIANARNLRSTLRQKRIARSVVLNQGATSGTLASSGVVGGVGSIDSQGNANVSFINQNADINTSLTGLQGQLADNTLNSALSTADNQVALAESRSTAATAGAIGGIAGTIFSDTGGYKSLFETNKDKPK